MHRAGSAEASAVYKGQRCPLTHGRGSFDGEPHMGTHTWPAMNSTIIAMVEDEKMPRVMEALRKLEKETQMQGMRAFVWDITDTL